MQLIKVKENKYINYKHRGKSHSLCNKACIAYERRGSNSLHECDVISAQ